MKLLVTDLDNTLYDWVTPYVLSFTEMVSALVALTGIEEGILLDEFKGVHRRYRDSEHPFAALELPSLKKMFPKLSRQDLASKIDSAFHAFNSKRNSLLKLYPGVEETLVWMKKKGIPVIGYTEASAANALFRLHKLKVLPYLDYLYTPTPLTPELVAKTNLLDLEMPSDFLRIVPQKLRKPNPTLLLEISTKYNIQTESIYCVGDSLTRDMAFAKNAGAVAIWAKYGTAYDKRLWDNLVRVTHWTQKDIQADMQLRNQYSKIQPDHTISTFSELRKIIS